MVYRAWFVLVVYCAVGSWGQGERGLPHTSPCPDVYSYGWEPAGGWHGIVTILPPARFSEAHLVFRMTVPYYRPEAGVGRVEIKGGNVEIQAISRRAYRGERHKIQFMIIFPPFDQIPRVKEVVINGKTFCADTRVYPDTRSTIELKYTLRTGLTLPVASGNDFAVADNTPTGVSNNQHPSRPDLVTVAILVPLDEARPMVSSPQAPTQPVGSGSQPLHPIEFAPQRPSRPIGGGAQSPRPIGSIGQAGPPEVPGAGSPNPTGVGSKPPSPPNASGIFSTAKKPCNCNKTNTQNEISNSDFPSNGAPQHHVFHAFNPTTSNVQINVDNIHDLYDIFTTTSKTLHSTSFSGNNNNNNNAIYNEPTTVPTTSSFHIHGPGQTSNSNGNNHHISSDTLKPHYPGTSSGSGSYHKDKDLASSTKKPNLNLSNQHRKPVDDNIYFIMTDSDEVNSPRIVKLLEHLLVISKKHYQVSLERLEIEKKRLALQQSPHLTLVV